MGVLPTLRGRRTDPLEPDQANLAIFLGHPVGNVNTILRVVAAMPGNTVHGGGGVANSGRSAFATVRTSCIVASPESKTTVDQEIEIRMARTIAKVWHPPPRLRFLPVDPGKPTLPEFKPVRA